MTNQPTSAYFATTVTNSPSSFCCKCNAFFIPTLRELCCLLVQIPCVGAHFSLQGAEPGCFGTWAVRRAKGAFLCLLRLLMIGRKREAPFTNALIPRHAAYAAGVAFSLTTSSQRDQTHSHQNSIVNSHNVRNVRRCYNCTTLF